jgi:hypothetical protein
MRGLLRLVALLIYVGAGYLIGSLVGRLGGTSRFVTQTALSWTDHEQTECRLTARCAHS